VAADLAAAVDAKRIDRELAAEALQRKAVRYDATGEEHYNVISAFIKSMRASDVDAAIYWLARMIEAGEDPLFIARRMVIFASEDVGLADAAALPLAIAARTRPRTLRAHPNRITHTWRSTRRSARCARAVRCRCRCTCATRRPE
jgi:replication-associated recombination protein RarA